MPDAPDSELIRQYLQTGAERAFEELVHRHVDLVYSTALRVLRNPTLAEDVTQRVFVSLASHARQLAQRPVLTGWLYETTRNFAVTTVRSEERRKHREQEVAHMESTNSNESTALWSQIEPALDDALSRLTPADRDLILWRYFERKTALQIGERLGVSAEAAQKRLVRAIDRLREMLADHGVPAPVAGLTALLASQSMQSAPSGLAASSIIAAGTSSAAFLADSTLKITIASMKAKIAVAVLLTTGVLTPLVLQHRENSRLTAEILSLRAQNSDLERLRADLARLTAEAQSSAQQKSKDNAELARLRSQVTSLKNDVRQPLASPKIQSAQNKKGDFSTATPSDLIHAEDWKNVGYQIPSATVQTLEWAKVNGETNAIANALAWADDQSRAAIDALFAAAPENVRARYGTADQYILSLFNTSGPTDDRHRLNSFRILSENKVSEDEAIVNMEYNYADGSTHNFDRRYVRIDNQWRQALEFDAPSRGKLSTGLQAQASTLPDQPPAK
jgi:RNA polymerase sigma factor (sigma-70 family)